MSQATQEALGSVGKRAEAIFAALDSQNHATLQALLAKLNPAEYISALAARNAFGEDVMMYAARRGCLPAIELMLEQCVTLDESLPLRRDRQGNTALLSACSAPPTVLTVIIARLLRAFWNIYDTNLENQSALEKVFRRYQRATTEPERQACVASVRLLVEYGALLAQRCNKDLLPLLEGIPSLPCFGATFSYALAKDALPQAYYSIEHLEAWMQAQQSLVASGMENPQVESAQAKLLNLQRVTAIYWQQRETRIGMRFFRAAPHSEVTEALQHDPVRPMLRAFSPLLGHDECANVPMQRLYADLLHLISISYRNAPNMSRLQYFFQQYNSQYYVLAWVLCVLCAAWGSFILHSILSDKLNNGQNIPNANLLTFMLPMGIVVLGIAGCFVSWAHSKVLVRAEHQLIAQSGAILQEMQEQLRMLEKAAPSIRLTGDLSFADLESNALVVGARLFKMEQRKPIVDEQGLEEVSLL